MIPTGSGPREAVAGVNKPEDEMRNQKYAVDVRKGLS